MSVAAILWVHIEPWRGQALADWDKAMDEHLASFIAVLSWAVATVPGQAGIE